MLYRQHHMCLLRLSRFFDSCCTFLLLAFFPGKSVIKAFSLPVALEVTPATTCMNLVLFVPTHLDNGAGGLIFGACLAKSWPSNSSTLGVYFVCGSEEAIVALFLLLLLVHSFVCYQLLFLFQNTQIF